MKQVEYSQPLRDLVIVRIDKAGKEKESAVGLLYQESDWATPERVAEVMSVGPDATSVKAGNHYYVNPYAAIDTEDEEIKILRERDVLCQIELVED